MAECRPLPCTTRRVGAPFEPDQCLVLVTDARAPDASVGRADPDRIASEFDAVILLRIDRLIRARSSRRRFCRRRWCRRRPGTIPATRRRRASCRTPRVSSQPTALSWPKTRLSCSSNRLWSAAKQLSTIVNCLRLRVEQLDLPCARALHREVLRKLVRRVLAVCRLILRRTDPRGHPDVSFRIHRDAAGIGLPLPDLLAPPVRSAGRIRIEHGPIRRNLDLARVFVRGSSTARMSESDTARTPTRSRSPLDCARRWRPHRCGGWSAAPSPTSRSRGCVRRRRTRRRFGIRPGGNFFGPIGERLPLLAEPLEDAAHVRAVGPIACGDPTPRASRPASPWEFHESHGAHLMAREARLVSRAIWDRVFSLGNFQQAQPVIRRIDLRGGAAVGRDDRFEVQCCPGFAATRAESTSPYPRTNT